MSPLTDNLPPPQKSDSVLIYEMIEDVRGYLPRSEWKGATKTYSAFMANPLQLENPCLTPEDKLMNFKRCLKTAALMSVNGLAKVHLHGTRTFTITLLK